MALKVYWTDRAQAHLRDVLDFIAFDNPKAAQALARRIFHAADLLAAFPFAGRALPELEGAPFREHVIPPCRLVYLVKEGTVIILVVLRSEQLLAPEWLELD